MEEKKLTGYPSIDKPWLQYYSEEAINAKLPEGTVYEYFRECTKDKLDYTALNYFGRKTSYGQLLSLIDRAAAKFLALGIIQGDVVPVAMASTPEMVISFYALNKIGAVSNWVDLRTIDESLTETAAHNAKALIMHDFCIELIHDNSVLERFPNIILASPSDSLPPIKKAAFMLTHAKIRPPLTNCILWDSFMASVPTGTSAECGCGLNHTGAIVHTGGTTGISKGVMLTNGNINAVAFQLINGSLLDAQPGERFLNLAPPFVAYGLCNSVHYPLCSGLELLLVPEHTPKDFPKLIYTLRPNHVFCVPVMWDALTQDKRTQHKRFPYLKTIVTGADKMDIALERKINGFLSEHDCCYEVAQGYGLTETGAGVCCSPQRNTLEPGSVGVPFVHTSIAIFEPGTHRELPCDTQREVCISGPTVMAGYYNNPEETKAFLHLHGDGRIWAHTGDLGRMMSNGYLFVDGRIKRMIVRHNGFKVFPPNIEKVILSNPAVAQCAVVGMRDPDNLQGLLPVAYVVSMDTSADVKTLHSELEALCIEKLTQLERPYKIIFRNSLPFTVVGKIDYRALEQMQAE